MGRSTGMWVVGAVLVLAGRAPGDPAAEQPRGRMSAAVAYDGAVLVVATDAGVAAFAFTERIHLGTGYTFRFRPAGGGKEQTGTGKVFERYKAVQRGGGPNDVTYVYDGGELWLTAGPVKLEWSRGGPTSGWVYFDPEKMKVQAVERARPESLDLKPFAR
jgi:hypothetical protein